MKPLMECDSIAQIVLFGNTVLITLMFGRKYDAIIQNGDDSRERFVHNLVFRNKVRYQM
jgi:hypothetical protein